jgi:hypothetical protein
MGSSGRGITEHTGIDTADVDIMMGTFTKSFGAMGGYIAADAETIAYLRRVCAGSSYHNAMSPVVCQQILTAFHVRIIHFALFCIAVHFAKPTPLKCLDFSGNHGPRWNRPWKKETPRFAGQCKLLSLAFARNGTTGTRAI